MTALLLALWSRLSALWGWLTKSPARLVIALLIVLCGFLALRLSSVDGQRDKWRDLARQYEAASKIVKEADRTADRIATEAAKQAKGEIDAQNERAREAAAGSPDKLRAALDRLRAEGAGRGGKAAE